MKRFITLLWTVAVLGSLTLVAQADVIAGPMLALWAISRLWPWFLVAIIVFITVRLLTKYREK